MVAEYIRKKAYPLNCCTLLDCNIHDMSPRWDRLTIVTNPSFDALVEDIKK
jgi:hypothetical protein